MDCDEGQAARRRCLGEQIEQEPMRVFVLTFGGFRQTAPFFSMRSN